MAVNEKQIVSNNDNKLRRTVFVVEARNDRTTRARDVSVVAELTNPTESVRLKCFVV